MDLFESARVPDNATIEDVIKTLAALKEEGHFKYIGMSECKATTLRRAHAVSAMPRYHTRNHLPTGVPDPPYHCR